MVSAYVQRRIGGTYLARGDIRPSPQPVVFIEEQITLCFPLAHQQGGVKLPGMVVETRQVYVAQDIHVVEQDGAVRIEERESLAQSASRVKQLGGLVRDRQIQPKIVVCPQEVYDCWEK